MESLQISEKEINTNLELVNEQKQNHFLDTKLGQVINSAINIGLCYLLPDLIEEQVIEIKDTLLENGLKEGIHRAIQKATELGKSTIGIFTGNFESISQAQSAIKKGGLIDGISEALDYVVDKTSKIGLIPKSISSVIKRGKNIVLDNVSKNIENEFMNQIKSLEELQKYEINWEKYYKEQNFNGMEREYNKIKKNLKEIIPLENTIKKGRQIENLHQLIKNKGGKFDLTNEQLELANMLI